MRNSRIFLALVAVAVSVSVLAQTTPPPSPPQLTWVRFFTIDPAQGEQFVSYIKRSPGAVFDRLLNDGKLASWGVAVPFIMTGQDDTHAVWITMNNWAAADEMVRAFDDAMMKMTPADRQKDMSTYMGMVKKMPHDVVIRHQVQSTAPPSPNYKLNYIRLAYSSVKPGRGPDRVAFYREVTVPTNTDLQARGVIGPWGFSTQEVGGEDWTHMAWIFTDDLASLDQTRDAAMSVPESVRTERAARVRDMINPEKSRVEIMRVVHIAFPRPRS